MTSAPIASSAPPTPTKKTASHRFPAQRSARELLTQLFTAAVGAVDPVGLMASRLQRDGQVFRVTGSSARWSGPTMIVGAGKAAPHMSEAASRVLGEDLIAGVVIAPHGSTNQVDRIACLEGGHPLPDAEGERSAAALLKLLDRYPSAAVLALISGGASSLMVQPTPPVSLADKIATNAALLACGADIHEFNTVRKHLSLVKGGGLARRARGRPLTALIISDVIGDDPATIGSGPTAADSTTFADALGVLERYRLIDKLPDSIGEVLRAGQRGEVPETLKPGAAELQRVTNVVVGSNRVALDSAAASARAAGYEPIIWDTPVSGDTTDAACRFVAWVREMRARRSTGMCMLAGGETTVQLDPRSGKGGRNQEFALVCAEQFAGDNLALLSAGTDGIDGPTDAAGAFVDATTLARARQLGLDCQDTRARHDSYGFFDGLGDLFRPGPTGTNVMDIKILLSDPTA